MLATVNSEVHIKTQTELKGCMQNPCPNRDMSKVLILRNTHLHTSLCTTEAISSFGWTVLLHPAYSINNERRTTRVRFLG